MSKNYKIYIVYHKEFPKPNHPFFIPIQVGRALSKIDLGILSDDFGQNISVKNKSYCELTAMYWVWKNDIDADYVGFCHYRRFFNFNKSQNSVVNASSANIHIVVNKIDRLDFLTKNYDFIVTRPYMLNTSLRDQYIEEHIPEDWDIFIDTIEKLYPSYKTSISKAFELRNKFYAYNMFITSKEKYLSYMSFLFNIMDELEKKIHVSEYPNQARVFGYLSERLFNLYIYHNKFTIKELPIYAFDFPNDNSSLLYHLLRNIYRNIYLKRIWSIKESLLFYIKNGGRR